MHATMHTPLPQLHPTPLPLSSLSWRLWAIPMVALAVLLAIIQSGQNIPLFLDLNSWAARGPAAPWEWLTALGDALTALCILLMFAKRRPDIVLSGMVAALLATVAIHVVKHALDLPRPLVVLGDEVHVIGGTVTKHAFPSGHTATAFTLIGILAAYVRTRALLLGLLVLATLVGLSRIAVGAHWPQDVAGGAAIGWLSGLAGVYLVRLWGWQARPRTHAAIRLLLLLCAANLLLLHDSSYPQADILEKIVALAALVWVLVFERLALLEPQAGVLPQTANSGSA